MKIGKVKPVEITEEMKQSYLDYAMSVIVARALPDIRDGLKPVHRRIFYAMQHKAVEEAVEQQMEFPSDPLPSLFPDPDEVRRITRTLVRGVTGNKPKLSQADAKLVYENVVSWCYHHMELNDLEYTLIEGVDH